jgi:hypothetical protein
VDPEGEPLLYDWAFGDGSSSGWLATNVTTHAYSSGACGLYATSVTISNDFNIATANLSVIAACELTVSKMQVAVNFAKTLSDSVSLSAVLDLPEDNVTQLNGVVLTMNVGGAQKSFTLEKGAGKSADGSTVKLAYTAAKGASPAHWTLTVKLEKETWRTEWAAYGLVNATVAKPGTSLTMPVVVQLGNEAFAADVPLTYTATLNKSGSGKQP